MHYSPPIPELAHRRFTVARTAALLAVVALGLAGCTSDDEAPGRRAAPDTEASATTPSENGGRPAPGDDSTRAPKGTADEAEVRDRQSRRTASGNAPGYVEIEKASVRADGDELLFTVRLAGDVPRQTSGGAGMRVTCQVLTADGEKLNLDARASESGWTAAGIAGAETFPVELHLGTEEIEMSIDRNLVGVSPFRWLASIAWVKGSAYAFDSAPEAGYADFPT